MKLHCQHRGYPCRKVEGSQTRPDVCSVRVWAIIPSNRISCDMRDLDGYLIEVGQYTQLAIDWFNSQS